MSNNSVVDERTLREIYTAAFETTMEKAAPKAIMSSYNQDKWRICKRKPRFIAEIIKRYIRISWNCGI